MLLSFVHKHESLLWTLVKMEVILKIKLQVFGYNNGSLQKILFHVQTIDGIPINQLLKSNITFDTTVYLF